MNLRRTYFRGRARPGEMNKLEAEYAAHLRGLQYAGEVLWWGFEAVKLKLARLTTYTPDFLVMAKDGTLECHETKGFWQDDAKVKIKVAAEKFPFRFVAITKKRGEWVTEEF
jgi:hypothetical protein